MSIYRKIQNAKTNPDTVRTGCYWYTEEDEKLLASVLEEKPLAQIALDLKRTCGGIELRLRTLAYNEYVKNKDTTTIIQTANKYKIDYDDFSMFVKDKEKYRLIKQKENEERELLKKQNKEIREEDLRKNRENKELAKKKEKELKLAKDEELRIAREEEKRKAREIEKEIKEAREEEKRKEKEIAEEIKDEEHNYIYCIREREFLRAGDNIFKVGKTTVHPFKRMKQYPNGSCIALILKVSNCHLAEQELLKYLDKKFETAMYNNQRIGREYYKATEEDIIQAIFSCLITTN
jgi:flagellar biosynthesis GTPase FlhF